MDVENIAASRLIDVVNARVHDQCIFKHIDGGEQRPEIQVNGDGGEIGALAATPSRCIGCPVDETGGHEFILWEEGKVLTIF